MTPLQLVRAECANYEHNGGCLGAMLGDDGRVIYCTARPRCLLAEQQRCAYFEANIAPMQHIATEPQRAAEVQVAVREYRKQTQQEEEVPPVGFNCGRPGVRRKEYCPACYGRRWEATARRACRNGRANDSRKSTVESKTPSKTSRSDSGFSGVSRRPHKDCGSLQNGPLLVVEAWTTVERGAGA